MWTQMVQYLLFSWILLSSIPTHAIFALLPLVVCPPPSRNQVNGERAHHCITTPAKMPTTGKMMPAQMVPQRSRKRKKSLKTKPVLIVCVVALECCGSRILLIASFISCAWARDESCVEAYAETDAWLHVISSTLAHAWAPAHSCMLLFSYSGGRQDKPLRCPEQVHDWTTIERVDKSDPVLSWSLKEQTW